ncbi:hypothetical protein BaRGS_00035403 [Batillaria attramentaria]|uniref:Uncharacterized protein n=1 Tax=Batillaria attramentaria TaxID=370345 RepID=A0ABD0JES3_9CAEN
MHPSEVDSKYPGVPIKKRNILKDILSRIENTAPQVAQWNTAPMLPPRRAPPPPVAPPDDSGSSDGDDWGSEFGQ